MTKIETLWTAVETQAREHRAFLRVDETHPLDLYAGIDLDASRVLLLVTDQRPSDVPPPGAVDVTVHEREDGTWALIVRLAKAELATLFGRLCEDLIETTRATTKRDGANVLLRRLQRWRRLMEPRHERSLTERELRGLIGELWFLEQIVIPRVEPWLAVQAWQGPLDAPQDFLIDGTLVEVKTTQPGAQNVPISSVAQLDVDAVMYISVVTLAPATAQTPDAFSPAILGARIRSAIDTSEAAANEFTLRLAETGYDDRADYANQWYAVQRVMYYRVDETFPRLRAKDVPDGICNVVYDIALHAVAGHQVQALVIGRAVNNAGQ